MKPLKSFVLGTFSLFVAVGLSLPAAAEYPTKAITLVSPYGPGGALRILRLGQSPQRRLPYLGEGVLVVNRTGAAGVIGSTFVAKGQSRMATPCCFRGLARKPPCRRSTPRFPTSGTISPSWECSSRILSCSP